MAPTKSGKYSQTSCCKSKDQKSSQSSPSSSSFPSTSSTWEREWRRKCWRWSVCWAGPCQPNPDPKWTDSHGGQTVYCGWHPNGLKKYNEYKATNTEARQGARSIGLEAAILNKLKRDWGVVGETPDQGKPTKKRKKDEEQEKVNTLDF